MASKLPDWMLPVVRLMYQNGLNGKHLHMRKSFSKFTGWCKHRFIVIHSQIILFICLSRIAFTQVYGLLLGLNSPEGLLPLLTTGNSKSVFSLFRRYISTIRHIFLWFNSDPFDPNSEAYKSLKTVRGLHNQVYQKLNQESGKVANGTTQLWMSQYAMVGAQFSFFGLMTLFPKQVFWSILNSLGP